MSIVFVLDKAENGSRVVLRAPRFRDLDLRVARQCVRRRGCGTSVETAEAMVRPMRRVGRILASAIEGAHPSLSQGSNTPAICAGPL